jgi:hypothetical protein
VSIEPVFSSSGSPAARRNFLTVESAVEAVQNAAEWSVKIENRNFVSSNTFVLESVIISYIHEEGMEGLTSKNQGYTTIVGY